MTACTTAEDAGGYPEETTTRVIPLGKIVVATHWSANAEYGPRFANYIGVPFRMTPYRDWTGHYADSDFEWAEADEIASAGALRT